MEITEKENNKEFYPWQLDAWRALDGKSGVLSSPTGSGKTRVAYLWAGLMDGTGGVHQPPAGSRVVFTAPIKALSNERYLELTDLGFDVGIETGDFKKNAGATVICCTQEIYALKYAGLPDQKLIIDEFHYIFDESERSRAYIDGIRHTHPDVPILVMSATFGKPETIVSYLERTADRPFALYVNSWRATELTWLDYGVSPREIHDALVFVFSMRGTGQIADLIADSRLDFDPRRKARLRDLAWILDVPTIRRCMYKGVGVYHGSLLPKEKLLVERAYRERILDVVVGTDALALGVNLPAETVVFGQLVKYHDRRPLTKTAFLQMSGRAGRKGLFEQGYVTWLDDSPAESRGVRTGEIFRALCNLPVETPQVILQPNYGAILKRRSTPSNEAEIVAQGSLPQMRYEAVLQTIRATLQTIDEEALIRSPENPEAFKGLLADIWYSEMDAVQNLAMAELFLKGTGDQSSGYRHPNGLAAAEVLLPQERNMLQALLRVKRFNNSLPDQYKLNGMDAVEDAIVSIDPTVFGFEDKIAEMNETETELPQVAVRLTKTVRPKKTSRRRRKAAPEANRAPGEEKVEKKSKKRRPKRRQNSKKKPTGGR